MAACKRRPDDAPPEMPVELLSSFDVNDPRATVQLTRGFYELEGNTWRWTAPEFSVVLAAPAGPTLLLEFKFTLPDVVFNETGPVTISASAGGAALPPQTFSTAGEHLYTADFPAPSGPAVAIDFKTDKHVTPGGADTRDLALIAQSVGLSGK
jgi:hypothetical protein